MRSNAEDIGARPRTPWEKRAATAQWDAGNRFKAERATGYSK
jgi:hypothetical protein